MGVNGTTADTHTAEINARDFGLMGDGTDETLAFQSFVNYLCANRRMGILPAPEYRVSSPINFPAAEGWGLRGMGMASTTVIQLADNAPIFRIGTGAEGKGVAGCRMWGITDMTLRYANDQPTTNTAANCIEFVAMCYQFELRRLFFYNGYYGQKTVSGQVVPWGSSWDDVYFNKHISGGAIDWTGVANAGPNNHFGRVFVEAQGQAGPLFIIQGYNTVMDTVEVLAAHKGPQLFRFAAKSNFTIHALKLEHAQYLASQILIDLPTQSHLEIGQFFISSTYSRFTPATGAIYAFSIGGGGGGSFLRVGSLIVEGTPEATNSYVFGGDRSNQIIVDKATVAGGWQLTNTGGAQTAEVVTVNSYNNGKITPDLGDADHTVTLGSTNHLYFETPLTTPRTVTLPSDSGHMHGGLTYEVVSAGAVNGANTLTVVSGTRVIAVIPVDNYRAEMVWRRHANGHDGWRIKSAGPIISA